MKLKFKISKHRLSLTCREFYDQRRIAHLVLQPQLISREQFERWLPRRKFEGVMSLHLTNLLLDIRNFRQLRRLSVNLEMSKKLRRSIVPQVSTDCLIPFINWPLMQDLSLDSLTSIPDLTNATDLRNLFLAFRSEGNLRFLQ